MNGPDRHGATDGSSADSSAGSSGADDASAPRVERIIAVGTYDAGTERADQWRRLADRLGVPLTEVHTDVWGSNRDRSFGAGWLLKAPALAAGLLRARRAIRAAAPNEVVAFWYPGHIDAAILGGVARRRGVPTVLDMFVSIHETIVEDRRLVADDGLVARLSRWLDRRAARNVDVVVLDTDSHADWLSDRTGVDRDAVAAVHVSADPLFLVAPEPAPDDPRPDGSVPDTGPEVAATVLYYGTYVPLHGVATIIDAATRLPDTRFELIGDGADRAAAQQQVAERGLTNVVFEDRVPLADLAARIDRAAVCLGVFGASDKAGRVVPNKVFQCAARGAVVVTREAPAVDDALGDSVLTVAPEDPEALAAAISDLLADPERRAELGDRARRRFATSFDDQAESARLDDALRHATRRRTEGSAKGSGGARFGILRR